MFKLELRVANHYANDNLNKILKDDYFDNEFNGNILYLNTVPHKGDILQLRGLQVEFSLIVHLANHQNDARIPTAILYVQSIHPESDIQMIQFELSKD